MRRLLKQPALLKNLLLFNLQVYGNAIATLRSAGW